ncbi:putative aldehyde dehydrogenase (NAD(+)) [Helianthus annuus]|uniref:Aldehyde dehydrogenase (NAD(+)) n=1 Tax=Helianthus annuus TaxID=4232 RepID=A0A9K3DH92_HELAN|nr:putative aldehyde dehydrogenase (NAD(+)) [Helianthus annuus]
MFGGPPYPNHLNPLFFTLLILLHGGKILTGGTVIKSKGNFVQPSLIEFSLSANVVKELLGPVLYVLKLTELYMLKLSQL